ncbi:hypothetical protein Tco_0785182 [Tanacetum coccineum]
MPPKRSSAPARAVDAAARAAAPMTAAAVEQLIEARVSAALANHETIRNSTNGYGDGSHNSGIGNRGTTRTPRECTYKDFLNYHPLNFKGTEGVVVLAQCPSMKSFTSHNVEALSHRINSIPTAGGSFLEVMDNLVHVGYTMGPWSQGKEKALWGNLSFDHAMSPSVGNSGGILCVWDPNMFIKEHISSSDYFLAVMGTWTPSATKLLILIIGVSLDVKPRSNGSIGSKTSIL